MENNFETADVGPEGASSDTAGRDVLIAACLILLGAAGLYFALKMPVKELYGAKWYTAPALLPAILSGSLMITSLFLAVKSLRISGGLRSDDIGGAVAYLRSKGFLRLALSAFTLTVYLFGLLGNMPYTVATFIYLFGTMFLFRTSTTWKSIMTMLVISLIVALGVDFAFSGFARIPLP
jgi:hypothetical protein